MVITAQFLIEGLPEVISWEHSAPYVYSLTAAEHSVVELAEVFLPNDPYFSHLSTPSMPWDLHILVPPKVRLVLSRPDTPQRAQSVRIDQHRDLVFNQGEMSTILELRGNFQDQTHFITPVPLGPDLVVSSRDIPRPLQDAFSVGLQPDPERPPPTLWDHLEDS